MRKPLTPLASLEPLKATVTKTMRRIRAEVQALLHLAVAMSHQDEPQVLLAITLLGVALVSLPVNALLAD